MTTLPDSLLKLKLAMCCPVGWDGTSLVRGEGPFFSMSRQDRRLEIELCPEVEGQQQITWNWIARNDVLFLQRPFRDIDIHAAILARMMNRPVWVDWDDDLTCLHPANVHAKLYPPEKMRATMGKLITLADVVTVTTEALKRKCEELGGHGRAGAPSHADKIRIIPNACHWPFSTAQRQRRVTWRGGHSHDADVMEFLPAIAEAARLPQFSQWKWCFLGEPPWQVKEAIPADRFEQWADQPHMYMPAFGYLGPWVNIVPLKDSAFNRSKSNLAWIEGTCAGAITVAPNWEEWKRPGTVQYDGAGDFGKVLRIVMGGFGDGGGHVTDSRRFIQDNLLLDHVNQRRWVVLQELMSREGAKEAKAA